MMNRAASQQNQKALLLLEDVFFLLQLLPLGLISSIHIITNNIWALRKCSLPPPCIQNGHENMLVFCYCHQLLYNKLSYYSWPSFFSNDSCAKVVMFKKESFFALL
uniref:Uncharacterized protein n=1 Tax=Heterosigma akashiwo TaxID=2829 RepID=A0A7S3Y1F7_HETAK